MKKILIGAIVALSIFFTGCSDEKKESTVTLEQKAPLIEETTTLETPSEEKSEANIVLITQEIENKEETPIQVEVASEIQQDDKEAMALGKKGAELYVKCSACHGQNAEQKALGISQVIQGWDSQKIVTSLKEYKNEIYGGDMKAIMIGQVITLSDEDMEALAQHISGL